MDDVVGTRARSALEEFLALHGMTLTPDERVACLSEAAQILDDIARMWDWALASIDNPEESSR